MRSLLKAPRLSFDEKLAESTEAFIRDLHPKTRRQTNTMDALRYVMFCQQRKRKNESLSSTSDSLRLRKKSLLAQLVERCTGIAEVMGSNPVRA